MVAKIQVSQGWVFLHGEDNKVLKSEKLVNSGATVIAVAKLRAWANKNGVKVG